MKLIVKYSYEANDIYPYSATTTYYGRHFFGVSKKNFKNAERNLLKTLAEAVKIQPPKPKEIEI